MKYLWYTFIIVIAGIGFYYLQGEVTGLSPQSQWDSRTPSSSRQPTNIKKCKYTAGDLAKPIVGFGTNIHEARADASQKCFDVRMHAMETKNVQGSEYYDRGLINIDECVNIRCS